MLDKIMQNQTKSANSKIDCAKECPCGVPVIPVPDQWLEVMVTGGFKVWHIIFIIIAFLVTMIVVYCCFHRCRIPRTKQEIEADLMRSNITSKFRDYLQDLPNEPTSFLEALKKVQELEEKSEKDDAEMARDAGARKRLGWLKLKGKGDKEGPAKVENGAGGEQLPEEKPLVAGNAEGEPQKTVIPEQVRLPVAGTPQAPAPPPEPPAVMPVVPNQDATQPKSLGHPITEPAGEQEGTKVRQPRRRKQKPNLSRTKRATENLGNGRNLRSPDMEPPPSPDQRQVAAVATPPPPDRPLERPPPSRHPPKQHTHRVRIEPKISGPPDV